MAAPQDIPNFSQVKTGVWRGGQPTANGWELLKSLGVKWVVKLNTEDEASDEAAKATGMQVLYLPMTTIQQTIGKPLSTTLNAAVSALEREGTFVHCQHGQDRTGLVVGAYRVKVEHWTKAAAYKEMKAHGFHPMLRGLYWSWQEDVP
jgi:protein tyrosine/serine phosphatase